MLKSLLRDRKLIILLALAVLIRLFAFFPSLVERYYTYGIYPAVSSVQRIVLGWIPFSIGDLLYLAAGVYLLVTLIRLTRSLVRREGRAWFSRSVLRRVVMLVLLVYVIFNLSWGLNYNRQGISPQLGLSVDSTAAREDLFRLTQELVTQLNEAAGRVEDRRMAQMGDHKVLYRHGIAVYGKAAGRYPFLRYRYPSLKSSLFSQVGHYFGFTGYYNPFSGEAQLKTSMPVFLKPFVLLHEMAHQVGYAKENEANFVAFLAASEADDPEFSYSVLFEMSLYALRDVQRIDSTLAKNMRAQWHPRVR
ncbi:MAG TPA: DUF3810 domain-containing protein, partial [Flavisolibacter sp.]